MRSISSPIQKFRPMYTSNRILPFYIIHRIRTYMPYRGVHEDGEMAVMGKWTPMTDD